MCKPRAMDAPPLKPWPKSAIPSESAYFEWYAQQGVEMNRRRQKPQ